MKKLVICLIVLGYFGMATLSARETTAVSLVDGNIRTETETWDRWFEWCPDGVTKEYHCTKGGAEMCSITNCPGGGGIQITIN